MVRKKDDDATWDEVSRVIETLQLEFHRATRSLADQIQAGLDQAANNSSSLYSLPSRT